MRKQDIIDIANELEESIQDVITDLSNFKGAEKDRQLYCYWRGLVWDIQKYLKSKAKEE